MNTKLPEEVNSTKRISRFARRNYEIYKEHYKSRNLNAILSLDELSELPLGPCWESEIYWSSDSNFVAYIANDIETKCSDEDTDRSVSIISVNDEKVYFVPDIAEDIKLIGWIPSQ